MTKSETIEIIEVLRRAYPKFILQLPGETLELSLKNTVSLWAEMLEPLPRDACVFAVKRLISESKFAPAISEVICRAKEALGSGQDGAVDAWNALSKAASRASVITQGEFEELPYEARKFCGGRSGLRDLGMLETEIFNTVTRGQFMKAYDGLRRRRETLEMMTPEIEKLVRGTGKAAPGTPRLTAPGEKDQPEKPSLSETMTESEWNDRRNQLLAMMKL